ncbi:hypothetical protein EZV77_27560 [Burkholderia thailandensis]|nr:hypothetical protein A8H31_18390 [Burkholderia thailandensis]AVR24581.1 hypothetical protein A8H32_05055 [Burkholderia thailandensis]AWY57874.1 hypothetical protein A8H35_04875 [Burkholderia thailandensis]AWY67953.1 hypothetical protein A8H36_23445 [Burkholderia thailandensis]MDD1481645.1 hypothetical protein [Burkholderia thailandensis]
MLDRTRAARERRPGASRRESHSRGAISLSCLDLAARRHDRPNDRAAAVRARLRTPKVAR